MKKEALINIIINDLKEVQQLMEAFRGESAVSSSFVNLAKTKIRNIEEEVLLLEQEFGYPVVSSSPVKENIVEKPKEVEMKPKAVERETKEIKEIIEESVSKNVAEVAPPVVGKEEKTIKESASAETKKKNSSDAQSTLADVLNKKKSAVNEKISLGKTENDLLYNKPVGDIRKAMGINDRFFYQRELFEGNSDLFNQTLDQLNSMSSFDDATNFLVSNFEWDKDSEVSDSFLKVVKRRFL